MILTINKKILSTAAIAIATVAGLFYFYFFDPADTKNIYVSCTFKNLTGWDCAGCGGQRAFHELLHFDILGALRYNALFVILFPYALILVYFTARQFITKKPFPKSFWFSNKMALIFVAVLLVFMIIRNLPVFPFTLLSTTG
ncbi:MAG: DUF2752 domain-containing protein [Moheibacter sp.]